MLGKATTAAPESDVMLDGAAIAAVWPCASLLAPMFIPEIDTADPARPAADEWRRDG